MGFIQHFLIFLPFAAILPVSFVTSAMTAAILYVSPETVGGKIAHLPDFSRLQYKVGLICPGKPHPH